MAYVEFYIQSNCQSGVGENIQSLQTIYLLYTLLQEVPGENVLPKQESEKRLMKSQGPGRNREGNPRPGEQLIQTRTEG